MVHVRDLKFHVCIPHEKKLTHIFSCLSYAPCLSYFPLKTKFENLVCKISRKVRISHTISRIYARYLVFMLEPSYLVYWLGLMSR